MSSWSCPHEVDGLCDRVSGACCRPGMRGCVLAGKVEFPDGLIPAPVWPATGRAARSGAADDRAEEQPETGRRGTGRSRTG